MFELLAGTGMADSGCRPAAGCEVILPCPAENNVRNDGPYKEVRHVAYYHFGPGEPSRSETAKVYQVGILGSVRKLQMASIPLDFLCPIGPDGIAAWKMMLDFPRERMWRR